MANSNQKSVWILMGFIFILISAMFVLTEYSNTFQHESVHQKACEYLGGEAKVTVGIFGGSTQCSYSASEEQRLTKYKLDVINEIVGYNMTSLRFTIWCISAVIMMMYCFFKLDDAFEKDQKEAKESQSPPPKSGMI